MDLRDEPVSSQGLFKDFGPYHFFTSSQSLDGSTNKGFMVGNAIGRDSRAIEAAPVIGFPTAPESNRLSLEQVGTLFLPRGGTITEGFVNLLTPSIPTGKPVLHSIRTISHTLLYERIATQYKRLATTRLESRLAPASLEGDSTHLRSPPRGIENATSGSAIRSRLRVGRLLDRLAASIDQAACNAKYLRAGPCCEQHRGE